jgi:hypothetical protein
MIGYIKQPFLGGMFSPKLNVMDREGGQTIATIQAQAKCFIGGMVSLLKKSLNWLLLLSSCWPKHALYIQSISAATILSGSTILRATTWVRL